MKQIIPWVFMALGLLPIASTAVAEAALEQAVKTVTKTHSNHLHSQQRINKIDDKTQQLLSQYQTISRQTESLSAYNQQLQRLLMSQRDEMSSLAQQIQDIDVTQREITPLMLRMVETLKHFVALDVPFLPQERQQRLDELSRILDRADVALSEKFRRIIEAYQIENDYGRTIEAYRADLMSSAKTRTVDFLRIGRVALFYQALDGKELGRWDQQQQQWQPLGMEYRNAINQGLRIARKQAAPDLLVLPLPAPLQIAGVQATGSQP